MLTINDTLTSDGVGQCSIALRREWYCTHRARDWCACNGERCAKWSLRMRLGSQCERKCCSPHSRQQRTLLWFVVPTAHPSQSCQLLGTVRGVACSTVYRFSSVGVVRAKRRRCGKPRLSLKCDCAGRRCRPHCEGGRCHRRARHPLQRSLQHRAAEIANLSEQRALRALRAPPLSPSFQFRSLVAQGACYDRWRALGCAACLFIGCTFG